MYKRRGQGYVVTPRLAGVIAQLAPLWDGFDATKAIYFQDGRPKAAGDVVRNPALANTLRQIAKKGPSAFYTGPIAQEIASAVSNAPRNAVPMTLADLSAYEAKERPPVCVMYRAYRLCRLGQPASGSTTVSPILGMVVRYAVQSLWTRRPNGYAWRVQIIALGVW